MSSFDSKSILSIGVGAALGVSAAYLLSKPASKEPLIEEPVARELKPGLKRQSTLK